jgi:hypothetical protein
MAEFISTEQKNVVQDFVMLLLGHQAQESWVLRLQEHPINGWFRAASPATRHCLER